MSLGVVLLLVGLVLALIGFQTLGIVLVVIGAVLAVVERA